MRPPNGRHAGASVSVEALQCMQGGRILLGGLPAAALEGQGGAQNGLQGHAVDLWHVEMIRCCGVFHILCPPTRVTNAVSPPTTPHPPTPQHSNKDDT